MHPPPDRKDVRNILIDNALANAFINFSGGAIMIGFVKHIGGGDLAIGLLAAVPSLMGLVQIPGAVIGRRFGGYKNYVAAFGITWRLLHIVFLILALMPGLGAARLPVLIITAGLAALSVQFSGPIYEDWMAEMIPPGTRGVFYARRSAICGAVGSGAGLLGGILLDVFARQSQPDVGYSAIFALGLISAAISFHFYMRVPDRPRPHIEKLGLRDALIAVRRPWQDPGFRPVLVFLFAFIFGQMFMGGLLAAYCLESLKMPFSMMQGLSMIQAAVSVLMAGWWGQMGDRYGNKPVLMVLCIGIALSPVGWFFTKPEENLFNVIILIPSHAVAGIMWAGVGITQFNLLLNKSVDEQRANYIAAGQSLMSVTAALSPFVGSLLMNSLRGNVPTQQAYLSVLGVCVLLRLASVVFLRPIHESNPIPVRQAIREIGRTAPLPFLGGRRDPADT